MFLRKRFESNSHGFYRSLNQVKCVQGSICEQDSHRYLIISSAGKMAQFYDCRKLIVRRLNKNSPVDKSTIASNCISGYKIEAHLAFRDKLLQYVSSLFRADRL